MQVLRLALTGEGDVLTDPEFGRQALQFTELGRRLRIGLGGLAADART